MDVSSTGVTRRSVKSFQVDSLDDPSEEEALDRAFGVDLDPHLGSVIPRVNDHPSTTQRELWGWYLYEGANQPYSRYVVKS